MGCENLLTPKPFGLSKFVPGQSRINGMHFTWEPSTSGRVLAPGPTLLATHSRGNHGGIAPTQIGEPT